MNRKSLGIGLAMSLAFVFGAIAEEHSLTVEVLDEAGFPVSELSPELLEVFAAEERLGVVEGVSDAQWRVSILIDQLLSEPRVVRNAAVDLAELADSLVSLGTVEVLGGREDYTRSVLPTGDADELRRALSWLRVRESGDAAQLEVRRRFVRDFEIEELGKRPYSAVSATAGQTLAELRLGVRQAIAEETRLLEQQRRMLLEWALENRAAGPALLVNVSGGEDDIYPFYEAVLERLGMSEVLEGLVRQALSPSREDLGRSLASLGWVTVTFTGGAGDSLLQGEEPGRRPGDEQVETVVQDGKIVDRTLFTPKFDPRDLLRRRKAGESSTIEARLLEPYLTATVVAEATSGDVAVNRQGLERVLERLGERQMLRLVDDSGSYEERPVRVQYALGIGETWAPPRARRWMSAGTPEIAAEARARRLLEDGIEEGPLLVTAQTGEQAGIATLAVEVESLEEGSEEFGLGPVRMTVGTLDGSGRASYRHLMLSPGGAIRKTDAGSLVLESPLPLSPGPGSPLVVLVEELESGRWGGTYAASLGAVGGDLLESLTSTPRKIHILEPESSMLIGPTLIETIHDQDVARVEFYVDGKLEQERSSPPLAAKIDLGKLPEPHRIEVVAYDSSGRELGRDRLSVNESGGIFRIRIVRPRLGGGDSRQQPLVGSVPVEALIESPRAVPVQRVEFFWNEQLMATRFAPPYLQIVPVPADDPQGFFRVVAHLEDGAVAEDVLFINSPGGSERVKVELIQLYTVVTDGNGRPVQGLDANRFRVLEEGQEQEIATFSEGKDQPLTVGLAIDTSASMFVKLPRVQKAASGFLTGLDDDKDRAFVVDFGTDPRLFHDTSKDLTAVESSLFDLEPGGQTAIWKGISYSLVQLQGVKGKKALIVFSDGADEDPDFSYRTCLKFARRAGVPIYVIVSNDEIHRTGGRGLNVRGFINRLESLTRAVGGRVYFSRVGEDLEEIYEQIDDELRSQYLLGYYARDEGEGRWRSVRVDVDEPGARARTIAGYFR